MQEETKETMRMGIMSYFNKLDKKEKNQFKMFVAESFRLSFFTVDGKFRGRNNFSPAELIALQTIINSETWRKSNFTNGKEK